MRRLRDRHVHAHAHGHGHGIIAMDAVDVKTKAPIEFSGRCERGVAVMNGRPTSMPSPSQCSPMEFISGSDSVSAGSYAKTLVLLLSSRMYGSYIYSIIWFYYIIRKQSIPMLESESVAVFVILNIRLLDEIVQAVMLITFGIRRLFFSSIVLLYRS